jgi:hypothetical protein
LVDLKEALSYPRPSVQRLLYMAASWADEPLPRDEVPARPCFQPRQKLSLADYLGEAEVQRLLDQFQAGVRKQYLAQRYGYSVSSVERLLWERGMRRWTIAARGQASTLGEKTASSSAKSSFRTHRESSTRT